MAYGVSNGHVNDDVTRPTKVLWGSTVGYPSDSLASCYVYWRRHAYTQQVIYMPCQSTDRRTYTHILVITRVRDWRYLKNIKIAWRISGIAVVSSIAIPETVSLSSLWFQVSHNTTIR